MRGEWWNEHESMSARFGGVGRPRYRRCRMTSAATTPADLILSGGGVKGVGLVGAVAALIDAGYRPQRVSGTSAGSILGAVVAAASKGENLTGAQVKDIAL